MFAGLAALVCATAALAQDSGPLIDLLVKKGIINDQEGEDLRAELAKDFAATPARQAEPFSANVRVQDLRATCAIRYEVAPARWQAMS
jgi:polyhydroxyalkanoate synthesis regulator phasin